MRIPARPRRHRRGIGAAERAGHVQARPVTTHPGRPHADIRVGEAAGRRTPQPRSPDPRGAPPRPRCPGNRLRSRRSAPHEVSHNRRITGLQGSTIPDVYGGNTVSKGVPGLLSLRPLREEDLPRLFEIQLDEEARHLAAFVTEDTKDRETYLAKHRKILADPEITNRGVEIDGKLVGSVAVFPIHGDIELTYWIHRDLWGQGVATAAVAELLDEVAVRPIHARVAEDNTGSRRVLERNEFMRTGSEGSYADGRQTTITMLTYELH
ncbi:GNAT family N-acetyltransferase [Streptomyces fungicidicus]|uniref:GNAT family N-acetyltransferase n=1 Tax=Streptomyces fungicidicus TaxID=68203 RepID=UPI003408EF62